MGDSFPFGYSSFSRPAVGASGLQPTPAAAGMYSFLSNVMDLLTDPTMMSYRTAMSLSLKRCHHNILLRHALWLLRGVDRNLIATVSMAMYATSLIPQRIALALHSTRAATPPMIAILHPSPPPPSPGPTQIGDFNMLLNPKSCPRKHVF